MAVSDSVWHRRLAEAGAAPAAESPFWMVPFESYRTFCPYLVGSHERIAAVVAHYLRAGYRTFILDVPFGEDDLAHQAAVFALAARAAGAPAGDVGAPR